MGPVQVLRVAVVAALGVAAGGPVAAARADEPIAIIDARAGEPALRAQSRADLALALRATPGLAPLADEARALPLAGDDDTADDTLADAALAATRERFGALDCAGVREPGQRAVQLLAGREAAGVDERVRLRAAWSYLLLCADREGARVPAQGFADRLRTLGGSPAIPADVWARYPEIDAGSELTLSELVIDGAAGAAGAEVWLDHRRIGVAPMKLSVASGGHVVAMARGSERVGLLVLVGEPGTLTIAVGLTSYAAGDAALAGQVRRWQAGAPVRAPELAAVLEQAEARFAIVLEGDRRASVWARATSSEAPEVVIEGELDQPLVLTAAIRDRLAAWERGPDPDRPLITETDLEVAAASRSQRKQSPWWVYLAISGAAAAGAVTIWALDAGEHRQRIELTFP